MTYSMGSLNRADAQTRLMGASETPLVRVVNTHPDGAGLRIAVEPGNPPLSINSPKLVKRLNADRLDGKHASAFYTRDQVDAAIEDAELSFYTNTETLTVKPGTEQINVTCDNLGTALGGGFYSLPSNLETQVVWAYPIGNFFAFAVYSEHGAEFDVTVYVSCVGPS